MEKELMKIKILTSVVVEIRDQRGKVIDRFNPVLITEKRGTLGQTLIFQKP